MVSSIFFFFFFQAEDGIRDKLVTGVQTCALPIWLRRLRHPVRLPLLLLRAPTLSVLLSVLRPLLALLRPELLLLADRLVLGAPRRTSPTSVTSPCAMPLDQRQQLLRISRLLQDGRSSHARRARCERIGGDDDHGDGEEPLVALLHRAEVPAAHTRHHQVEQDQAR